MDHCFKACISFARTHGYTFELFESLKEVFDKVSLNRPGFTGEEQANGFRICDPAQAPESSGPKVDYDDDFDDLI